MRYNKHKALITYYQAPHRVCELNTIYYPQKDGGFTVIRPELGLTTQGEDMQEVQNMMNDLIQDYMEYDKVMDFEDYVEGFNVGHKIITELDYEFARAD